MKLYKDKHWLVDQYISQEKSTVEIAEELGCAINTVNRRLRLYDISVRRKHTNRAKQKISRSNVGRKQSEETIQKKRDSRRGYTHSAITRKKISEKAKGRKPSNKTKAKMSKAGKGKPKSDEFKRKVSGSNSYLWRGGISFEPYGLGFNRALREKIRDRDSRVCQVCGKTEDENGINLDVHHMDYDKRNNSPENLISLCMSCHSKTNINRDDWITYFSNISNIANTLLGGISHG